MNSALRFFPCVAVLWGLFSAPGAIAAEPEADTLYVAKEFEDDGLQNGTVRWVSQTMGTVEGLRNVSFNGKKNAFTRLGDAIDAAA